MGRKGLGVVESVVVLVFIWSGFRPGVMIYPNYGLGLINVRIFLKNTVRKETFLWISIVFVLN